jgi:hypothetical protein
MLVIPPNIVATRSKGSCKGPKIIIWRVGSYIFDIHREIGQLKLSRQKLPNNRNSREAGMIEICMVSLGCKQTVL